MKASSIKRAVAVTPVHLVPIGNSKGIRLPKAILQKYGFKEELLLEETSDGILIRNPAATQKLSWEETYRAMAQEKEDWQEWDVAVADGLEEDEF